MTVKEHADALGMTTLELFKIAYGRHGLVYSIGGPEETHKRYEQAGVVPLYVTKYIGELERLQRYKRYDDPEQPLFI